MSQYRPLAVVLSTGLAFSAPAPGAVLGEPSAPWPTLPGDTPREAVHDCAGPEAWTVTLGGNLDGASCRDVVGYAAFAQYWQPDVEVSIANLGETAVHNPRVVTNDSRDWGSVDAIVAEATRGCHSVGERARALYEFQRRRRFHACTWDNECSDAVKAYNVYGYTLCGNDATILSDLWTAAGVPCRVVHPVGHCVSQVLYDGRWHMLDGDEHGVYLLRDNETVGGEEDVVRDHDLIKRTHTYGILSPDNPLLDQFSASLFGYTGPIQYVRHSGPSTHTMDWDLLPGGTMTWRWSHLGKEYSAGRIDVDRYKQDGDGDLLRGWGAQAYARMCNATLTYEPDLATAAGRLGLVEADAVAPLGAAGPKLRPAESGQAATATWRFALPYVIVGLRVQLEGVRPAAGDKLAVSLSADGKTFAPVGAVETTGPAKLGLVLDQQVSPQAKPQYTAWVRLELLSSSDAPVGIDHARFDVDVQTSLLSLPELSLGDNRVEYRDDADGPRRLRITQRWVERTAWSRPSAPAAPVSPADGAAVEGTKVSFEWQPSTCADGVSDYHFELSAYPDMRWPLSSNFEKLISHTDQKGTCSYLLPSDGLLNPGRSYYWHVRARSSNHVWGPWSPTWSFRCAAPGVPLYVRLEPIDNGQRYVLRWAANPLGRIPQSYRVYASNEQGFTAHDEAYPVDQGAGTVTTDEEFDARAKDANWQRRTEWPANFVAETAAPELVVAGPGVELRGANSAFYRVVAVDEEGNRSGASDFAAMPRPWFCTAPPAHADPGAQFSYRPQVILSLGHLTCQNGYRAAYWQAEQPKFELLKGPECLQLDPATGELSGIMENGEHEIVLAATSSAGRAEQKFTLQVP